MVLADILPVSQQSDRFGCWSNKAAKGKAVFPFILKVVPLAMGIAVMVLSLLGELDVRSGFALLGIGLASVGLSLLQTG